MAKKRNIDPGLQYLQQIGFNRITGKYGLADRFKKIFGDTEAKRIWDKWESMSSGSVEFYNFKNSDPEISKAFSEAYDGDIIRKACNYISSHKDFFGGSILEVGCESGYMTGFLAKSFPEAKIVSIDRSSAAIEVTSKKLQSMGISNVELRNCSLEEVSEKFDTVFCMRTIQENINDEEMPFTGEPLIYQFFCYAGLTEKYTSQLLSRLNEDGSLCVFERVAHDPLMCGWMIELNQKEFGMLPDSYMEFSCEEAGEHNTFQSFICKHGNKKEINEIIQLWYEALEINYEGKTIISGWNALAYLNDNAGEMLRGVRILNKDGEQVGRFAAFLDRDGDPTILYLNAPGGSEMQLFSFDISIKDDVLKRLQDVVDHNVKNGLVAEEIDPEEDFIEGKGITH